MSPEQARAPKSADARSDIWSLGIVLYELVLGERPFRGETPVAILASLLSDKLPEMSAEQRRRMPDELMAVVRRCLNRDPDQRFANVGELARALLPMATPSSEQVVVRIENMDRTIPIVDTPQAESPPVSPPVSPHTHGTTLVSARSSLVGATSSTHSLDPHEAPVVRRAFGVKALALLAAIAAALCYWFVVSRIRVPNDLDAAPSAQSQPPSKSDKPVPANGIKEPREQAPRASVEVSPVPPTLEVTPTASALPAASAVPTASAAPSATVHPDRKSNARTQATPSAAPAATTAPAATGKGRALPSGPPRPSSTADPKNQPE